MRLKRYYHTLKYLKLSQTLGRIWFRYKKIKLSSEPTPAPRPIINSWLACCEKKISMLDQDIFIFLSEQHQLTFPSAWNNSVYKKLWLYNLHYFDDLNAEDSRLRNTWHLNLINQWIQDNPAPKGIGWDPYPLSLRIVNWIKWSLRQENLSDILLNNLAEQVRVLQQRLEFHILGNHLFANAKALIFAGLFFSGPEAEIWLKSGIDILKKQLPEQILVDGGHFERSPMYHAIILEDILDLLNLSQSYNYTLPISLAQTATKMLAWLDTMTHPDGEIVLFNDAAFNVAPKFSELLNYAQALKISLPNFDIPKTHHLKTTGYARLTNNNAHVFIDAAPLGPDYLLGHAHADTLTFEFSLGKQRIIVDSGTSLYETNAERLRQRSTSAHNTITINQQNSSDIWSSFRVAKRAKIRNIAFENNNKIIFSAMHTGYQHMVGNPIHKRTWNLANSTLLIQDEILGHHAHNLELHFYFHPDLTINQRSSHLFELTMAQNTLAIRFELDPQLKSQIQSSTYHPEFGQSLLNKKLIAKIAGNLPCSFTHKFSW